MSEVIMEANYMSKYLSPNPKPEEDTGFRPTGLHTYYHPRRYYKEHYIQFIFRFPFP